MPTLDDIRQEMPQYQGISDAFVFDDVSKKYFPGVDRRALAKEFNYDLPLQTDTVGDSLKAVGEGALRTIGNAPALLDIPLAALGVDGRPAASSFEALGNDIGFTPTKWAEETPYSEAQRASDANIEAAWGDHDASNLDIAKAYVGNLRHTAKAMLTSIVPMVTYGMAGRAMGAAAGLESATAGAAGEGVGIAADTMSEIDRKVDPQTAALASVGAGTAGTAIGKLAAGAASRLAGASDIDTLLAQGATKAAGGGEASLLQRTSVGGLSESAEEGVQSATQQAAQNIAEGKPVGEGVPRQTVEGMTAAAPFGVGANLLPVADSEQPPAVKKTEMPDITPVMQSGSVDEAIANAQAVAVQPAQPKAKAAFNPGLTAKASPDYRALGDFIGKGEGRYTSVNKGTHNGKIVGSGDDNNLVGMTIGQIKALQNQHVTAQKGGNPGQGLFAVGKYQFIPGTFARAAAKAGLGDNDVFSPLNQERMFLANLPDKVRDYLAGSHNDLDGALEALSKEWASIPSVSKGGNSYYGEGNKASHSLAEARNALIAARNGGAGAGIGEAALPFVTPELSQPGATGQQEQPGILDSVKFEDDKPAEVIDEAKPDQPEPAESPAPADTPAAVEQQPLPKAAEFLQEQPALAGTETTAAQGLRPNAGAGKTASVKDAAAVPVQPPDRADKRPNRGLRPPQGDLFTEGLDGQAVTPENESPALSQPKGAQEKAPAQPSLATRDADLKAIREKLLRGDPKLAAPHKAKTRQVKLQQAAELYDAQLPFDEYRQLGYNRGKAEAQARQDYDAVRRRYGLEKTAQNAQNVTNFAQQGAEKLTSADVASKDFNASNGPYFGKPIPDDAFDFLDAPVDAAAHEAATSPLNDLPEPSQAQKEAGNGSNNKASAKATHWRDAIKGRDTFGKVDVLRAIASKSKVADELRDLLAEAERLEVDGSQHIDPALTQDFIHNPYAPEDVKAGAQALRDRFYGVDETAKNEHINQDVSIKGGNKDIQPELLASTVTVKSGGKVVASYQVGEELQAIAAKRQALERYRRCVGGG